MCISIENKSTKFTRANIKNDELRAYANILVQDAMNIRANLLHMSAIMASIDSRRDTGILNEFDNSIVKFAEDRLGIKKSQVYSMVNVGRTFLDDDGKSLLPEKGGKWNNTQFMALLPMSGTGKNKRSEIETLAACTELVDKGIIKPSMTVAEIKEIVRTNRPDAEKLAEKAAKRAEKKNAETKSDVTETETEDIVRINGTLVGKIEIYQIDEKLHAVINGTEPEIIDDTFINGIVDMLHRTINYKM